MNQEDFRQQAIELCGELGLTGPQPPGKIQEADAINFVAKSLHEVYQISDTREVCVGSRELPTTAEERAEAAKIFDADDRKFGLEGMRIGEPVLLDFIYETRAAITDGLVEQARSQFGLFADRVARHLGVEGDDAVAKIVRALAAAKAHSGNAAMSPSSS